MNSRRFKLLIVTDFDRLAQDQQGFRDLMEGYGGTACSSCSRARSPAVIDPIISTMPGAAAEATYTYPFL